MVRKEVTDLSSNAKVSEMRQNTHRLWIVSPSTQLKGPLNLWIVGCGSRVRQSKEGVENGHGWLMGPKR